MTKVPFERSTTSKPIPDGRFRPSALPNSVDVAPLTGASVGMPSSLSPKTMSSSLLLLASAAEPALMLAVMTYSPSGEKRIADGRLGRLRVELAMGVRSPAANV